MRHLKTNSYVDDNSFGAGASHSRNKSTKATQRKSKSKYEKSEDDSIDRSTDVTFQQLHESIKGLSTAVSSLIRQEEEERTMREELIKMLPDILAALAGDEDDTSEEIHSI